MNKNITLRILRYSWVVLFLWFGYQQMVDPASWVIYLPEWTGYFPIPAEMLIRLNGWSELILALFLALGIWMRPVLILLTLHLFGIALEVGGAIGMRDFILGMIGIALLSDTSDRWPMGNTSKEKKVS